MSTHNKSKFHFLVFGAIFLDVIVFLLLLCYFVLPCLNWSHL